MFVTEVGGVFKEVFIRVLEFFRERSTVKSRYFFGKFVFVF